jgi:replicative DNA helicase
MSIQSPASICTPHPGSIGSTPLAPDPEEFARRALDSLTGEGAAQMGVADLKGRCVKEGIEFGAVLTAITRLRPGFVVRTPARPMSSADSADSAEGPDHRHWPSPLALGFDGALPSFPLTALPGQLRRFVEAIAEETQTPPDLAGMLGLAVVATVLAKRVRVHVGDNWYEPLNLYTVVALPSGERKSAVFTMVVRPLERLETEKASEAQEAIREAEIRKKTAEAKANAAEKAAINPGDDADAERLIAEAIAARGESDRIKVPSVPRFLADDITQERLAGLLSEHGGRMAILSAEGGIFEIMAGRYSKDGQPNIEVFLKGHSGDNLRVDRIGRPSEQVEGPALTLGLAVQPDVIVGLAGARGFRGRGLIARILFSNPTSRVGSRIIDPQPASKQVVTEYEAMIRGLAELVGDDADPRTIGLTDVARCALSAYRASLEPRLGIGGDLHGIGDWANKLAGNAVRIAGLLHLARHGREGLDRGIEKATMEQALALADYLIPHALAAHDLMGQDAETATAKKVLGWISKCAGGQFSEREAFNALRGSFKVMGPLSAALSILVRHGYVRPVAPVLKGGPGRPPSPRYDVHPEWQSR